MLYRPLFAGLEPFSGPGAKKIVTDASLSLLRDLLREGLPLLDVRAPVEFAKGAFPTAHNLPLLYDEERAAVGTRYKQAGQDAAIALGHQLVGGSTRQSRLEGWSGWLAEHPGAWLYCFRGGLRSRTVQQWLAESGIHCPRVPGGYKAMRQVLIDTIDAAPQRFALTVIAGPTGSGKTHLLNTLPVSADLEGFAHHRGSAFGSRLEGQPTQISFENALAVRLLQLERWQGSRLYVEDESQAIGSLAIPMQLHAAMKASPILLVEESLESRATTILKDYIEDNLHQFQQADPETALSRFSLYLRSALAKIQRRLGGERYEEIGRLMDEALRRQDVSGETEAHRDWIVRLLETYYDPMYSYQLSRRLERVIFKGDADAIRAWVRDQDSARA